MTDLGKSCEDGGACTLPNIYCAFPNCRKGLKVRPMDSDAIRERSESITYADYSEVNSCPFCGEVVHIMIREDRRLGLQLFHVVCRTCGSRAAEAFPREKAITLWNTRTLASPYPSAIRAIDPASIAEGDVTKGMSHYQRAGMMVHQIARAFDNVPRGYSEGVARIYEHAERIAIQHLNEATAQSTDDGWNHDMSAAPRDVVLDLYDPGLLGPLFNGVFRGEYDKRFGEWASFGYGFLKPTAWRHLPEPPRGK